MYIHLLFMMEKLVVRRSLRHLLSFLLLSGQTVIVCADDWELPTERSYKSENGEYVFRVTPNSGSLLLVGRCRGVLYAKDGKELRREWERPLINNHAPCFAVVSDSGKYVVTLSEWADLDSLPVVFYGRVGNLINVYGRLDQLVSAWELRGVPASISGFDWLSHALCFFGPNEDYFIIRLRTGPVLVFETESGQQVDKGWKQKYRARESVRKYEKLRAELQRLIVLKALRLASCDEPGAKEDGRFVLGQYTDKESISLIQQALNDETSRIVELPEGKVRQYPVRKAAKDALEAAGEKVPENTVLEERIE